MARNSSNSGRKQAHFEKKQTQNYSDIGQTGKIL
jgi:hypothetical protein